VNDRSLTVTSLADFIDVVSGIEKRWYSEREPWGLWYRGHHKSHWELLPTLYRILGAEDDPRAEDDEVREDFIKRAPSLTDRKPENPWEWYFLMQHYRAPTRLLDWTEGALIALHFATNSNQGLHDSAVWILDPWWLNKKVVRIEEVVPPGAPGISKPDRTRYAPWLPSQFDGKTLRRKMPVAIYPNHIDRRIIAQKSCFTIHGSRREGLEKILNRQDDHLAKVTIPSYCVGKIKDQLELSGIDEVAVFPDLEGLGRAVSKDFESYPRAMPHKNVHTRLAPSRIHRGGVGVFSIGKIKKGTPLFNGDNDEMQWVREDLIPKGPKAIRRLYDDFAVIKNGRYGCPLTFNRLTMSWYLNHSTNPNLKCTDDYDFVAARDISLGEELTVDYPTYNDSKALERLKQSGRRRTPNPRNKN
jgi:hypothetical protein